MSEVALVVSAPDNPSDHSVRIGTWAGMAAGDTGEAFGYPSRSARSVQVVGTLGVGGKVTMKGSNDGVNYHTLSDLDGNALEIDSLRTEGIREATAFIKT